MTFAKTLKVESRYFAVLQRSDPNSICDINGYTLFTAVNNQLDLIPVKDLINVSFALNVKDDLYIIEPINNFDLI